MIANDSHAIFVVEFSVTNFLAQNESLLQVLVAIEWYYQAVARNFEST